MAYIFQKLSKQAGKANISQKDVADAREWFRTEAGNIKKVNTNKLMQTAFDSPQMSPASIGQMFMFFYDPKTKKTLPKQQISKKFRFKEMPITTKTRLATCCTMPSFLL